MHEWDGIVIKLPRVIKDRNGIITLHTVSKHSLCPVDS